MELTINIENYLDESEIKAIAQDVIREAFARQLRTSLDLETFLSNVCYLSFFNKLCDSMNITNEEIDNIITQNLRNLLNQDDTYRFLIFEREGENYHTRTSPAAKILDDVLSNSRPQIEAKVNALIEKYPFRELREEIEYTIYDCIKQRLFSKTQEEK